MEMTATAWQDEMVSCIHFLHQKGYAPATSSNYSHRKKDQKGFHISVSGVDKGAFTKNHFMEVSLEGKPVSDNRRPSAETLLHAMIYQKLAEVGCVLHTHTVYNTVMSSIFEKAGCLTLEGYEVLKGLPGIKTHETSIEVPVFPNAQDMPALVRQIEAYWDQNPDMKGFLLGGHGLYTWGNSIASAKRHVEVFEFLFEVQYKIQSFSVVSLPN